MSGSYYFTYKIIEHATVRVTDDLFYHSGGSVSSQAKVSVLYQKCNKLCICGLRHSQQGRIYLRLGGYPRIYQFFCLVLY